MLRYKFVRCNQMNLLFSDYTLSVTILKFYFCEHLHNLRYQCSINGTQLTLLYSEDKKVKHKIKDNRAFFASSTKSKVKR